MIGENRQLVTEEPVEVQDLRRITNHFLFLFLFETEDRQGNAKAHDTVDHLTNFLPSKHENSQLGIEPPTSSLRSGFLSTIIQ